MRRVLGSLLVLSSLAVTQSEAFVLGPITNWEQAKLMSGATQPSLGFEKPFYNPPQDGSGYQALCLDDGTFQSVCQKDLGQNVEVLSTMIPGLEGTHEPQVGVWAAGGAASQDKQMLSCIYGFSEPGDCEFSIDTTYFGAWFMDNDHSSLLMRITEDDGTETDVWCGTEVIAPANVPQLCFVHSTRRITTIDLLPQGTIGDPEQAQTVLVGAIVVGALSVQPMVTGITLASTAPVAPIPPEVVKPLAVKQQTAFLTKLSADAEYKRNGRKVTSAIKTRVTKAVGLNHLATYLFLKQRLMVP